MPKIHNIIRICRECGFKIYSQKGLELFKKDKTAKYGVDAICKKCYNKQCREQYLVNNPTIDKPTYLKNCRVCNLEANTTEELELFSKDKNTRIGVQNICKACKRIESRERATSNAETYRKNHYKIKFNITINDYNLMLEKQENSCWICGKNVVETNKHFNIDHCHTTGKIRGLLCHNCNTGIGMFKDSILLLNNAIKYLQKEEDK